MSRAAPALPQRETERRAALLAMDVPAMRRWMSVYGVGAFGIDAVIYLSMHETRAVDPEMPDAARLESWRWLRANFPGSSVLTVRELVEEMERLQKESADGTAT